MSDFLAMSSTLLIGDVVIETLDGLEVQIDVRQCVNVADVIHLARTAMAPRFQNVPLNDLAMFTSRQSVEPLDSLTTVAELIHRHEIRSLPALFSSRASLNCAQFEKEVSLSTSLLKVFRFVELKQISTQRMIPAFKRNLKSGKYFNAENIYCYLKGAVY